MRRWPRSWGFDDAPVPVILPEPVDELKCADGRDRHEERIPGVLDTASLCRGGPEEGESCS
jgi:hypothetical protein